MFCMLIVTAPPEEAGVADFAGVELVPEEELELPQPARARQPRPQRRTRLVITPIMPRELDEYRRMVRQHTAIEDLEPARGEAPDEHEVHVVAGRDGEAAHVRIADVQVAAEDHARRTAPAFGRALDVRIGARIRMHLR